MSEVIFIFFIFFATGSLIFVLNSNSSTMLGGKLIFHMTYHIAGMTPTYCILQQDNENNEEWDLVRKYLVALRGADRKILRRHRTGKTGDMTV